MKWTLEKRKITELKKHPKNPRQLKKEQAQHLSKSLEKFGQCEPIVINTDNTIIGGHQRVATLKKMGVKEVDVYVPDNELSTQDVEELNIRLNKNVGDWDYDILANEWDVLDLLEWGFSDDELQIDSDFLEDEKEEKKEKKESEKIVTCPNCDHVFEA